MLHDTQPRLLGDIGGTNARFAWQDHPQAPPSAIATYPCADSDSLLQAIQRYLAAHGHATPRQCAIGIANPITGDRVRMTNHHWSFSISELQRDLGLERLVVLNDFTALALSLPSLSAADLQPIGTGTAVAGAALAVVGPGTGLGVSGLLPAGAGRYVPINGEGGHVTLAPCDDLEAEVLLRLRHRFGHVSAERALSGPGLINLYNAVNELQGRDALSLQPGDIIARARSEEDDACTRALDLFCAFLGGVAGNLALTLGARGGVFLGGGIAPRILPELRSSLFRQRFEGKGRFGDYLAAIPTCVITTTVSPALIGASRALDEA